MSFRIQIVVLLTVAGALFASGVGVGQVFRKAVEPLIESSCIHCHDGSEDNGLDFSNLKNNLVDSDTFRKWERIFDRVEKNEMPPASEDRPSKSHRLMRLRRSSKPWSLKTCGFKSRTAE